MKDQKLKKRCKNMYFHGVKSTAHPPIIGTLGHSTDYIVRQPNTAVINIHLDSIAISPCLARREAPGWSSISWFTNNQAHWHQKIWSLFSISSFLTFLSLHTSYNRHITIIVPVKCQTFLKRWIANEKLEARICQSKIRIELHSPFKC